MRIEYIKYYLDFCKTRSISKTAARYYMTPQGISRALHQLEDELEVMLFVRDGNNIVLTEAGRMFEEHAHDIVASYDKAQESLRRLVGSHENAEDEEPVCLVSTTCSSTYFMPHLGLLKRRALPFSLRLRETNLFRICAYIESATSMLTLGLISVPLTDKYTSLVESQLEDHGLAMIPVACSPLAIMAVGDNPLVQRKVLKRKDVADLPVVCYRDAVLLDALDDFVREDQILDITSNSMVLANQLREWHAISFAPRIACLDEGLEAAGLKVLPFDRGEGFFDTQFGIIGKRDEIKSDRAQELTSYIFERLNQLVATSASALISVCGNCSGADGCSEG